MNILIALPEFDRIYRAGLLTEAAEYAAQGVDLVTLRIPEAAVIGFFDFKGDAARWADNHAEPAGNAGGIPSFVLFKIVHTPPAGRYRSSFLRVPDGHRFGEKHL